MNTNCLYFKTIHPARYSLQSLKCTAFLVFIHPFKTAAPYCSTKLPGPKLESLIPLYIRETTARNSPVTGRRCSCRFSQTLCSHLNCSSFCYQSLQNFPASFVKIWAGSQKAVRQSWKLVGTISSLVEERQAFGANAELKFWEK